LTRDATKSRDILVLSAVAAFTFAWAVIRAQVQSITIDEADTFLVWAARQDASHWLAGSNNHVLNSLVMRLATSVFGVYHLTVRLPALLGGALYLSGASALCMSLHRGMVSRLVLFSLLALNPMTQDYLVAARGYAMASGFLVWALWLVLREQGVKTPRAAALMSACLALSFASNFAFAWVCFSVFLVAALQARRAGVRTWIGLTVPAATISLVFSSYTALTMPRQQLFFGTRSMGRMFGSVMDSFISAPNPHLSNPWVLAALNGIRPYLVPAMLAGLAGTLILAIGTRTRPRCTLLLLRSARDHGRHTLRGLSNHRNRAAPRAYRHIPHSVVHRAIQHCRFARVPRSICGILAGRLPGCAGGDCRVCLVLHAADVVR
jgi:hypothetical protein